MTEFEFLFILYALVLGLSVVELLSGFGAALERVYNNPSATSKFRIGWLTPLFGLFVLLDLMSFWLFAWIVRDFIQFSAPTVLGILGFASAYYLAARLVFPTDPSRFEDLDTHYFRVRRTVLGILIVLIGVQWAYLSTIEAIREQLISPVSIIATSVLVGLMALAMVIRSTRWSVAVLAALCLRYLYVYLL